MCDAKEREVSQEKDRVGVVTNRGELGRKPWREEARAELSAGSVCGENTNGFPSFVS